MRLIDLKIALEELKQRKIDESLSEEVYNKELRKIYLEYKKLKKESLENELNEDTIIFPINLSIS